MTFDEFLQSTLAKESELVNSANQQYGDYYNNATDFLSLLTTFIKEINPNGYVFGLYLSQLRKSLLLSFLSCLRNHQEQTLLTLRVGYESMVLAAYAIKHPDETEFIEKNEQGILYEKTNLRKNCYKWLAENYPTQSTSIKGQKDIISASAAHANVIYPFTYTNLDYENRKIEFNFFDHEDGYVTKTNLWQIANCAMGAMDLFALVNREQRLFVLKDNFVELLKTFEASNHALKAQMMESKRFQKSLEIKSQEDKSAQ